MSQEKTITSVLKEATEGILTEDALTEIETVFEQSINERVALHVEKALAEQDDDHADKLEKLLEAIDTDHTAKLNKLVDAINHDHADKLSQAAKKFNQTLNEDAGEFKSELVSNISNYLDLYLEKTIPAQDIKKAMRNTTAVKMLGQLREALAVDNALSKKSIRGAVKDGKSKIENLSKATKQLQENNHKLTHELTVAQAQLVLENKTKGLPESKKKYMLKVLGNKTPKFIQENYDYTLKLLEKTEEQRLENFKKEAVQNKPKVDRVAKTQVLAEKTEHKQPVVEQISESVNPLLDNYMAELKKT